MSSGAKYGYDFKIDSGVSPAARRPCSRETGKRKPRIKGFPQQTSEFIVMR